MTQPTDGPDLTMDADAPDLVLDANGNEQRAGGFVLTTAGWRPLQDGVDNTPPEQ